MSWYVKMRILGGTYVEMLSWGWGPNTGIRACIFFFKKVLVLLFWTVWIHPRRNQRACWSWKSWSPEWWDIKMCVMQVPRLWYFIITARLNWSTLTLIIMLYEKYYDSSYYCSLHFLRRCVFQNSYSTSPTQYSI